MDFLLERKTADKAVLVPALADEAARAITRRGSRPRESAPVTSGRALGAELTQQKRAPDSRTRAAATETPTFENRLTCRAGRRKGSLYAVPPCLSPSLLYRQHPHFVVLIFEPKSSKSDGVKTVLFGSRCM